jgi:exodeoxyribonuclease VII large subunit
VSAIQLANKVSDIDVLIIGRGGGSVEDMWCFNDERVARAIAASRIPTISAVGHEIDFTIADFVADLRAPTPSAAAELVAKSAGEVLEKIQNLKGRLWQTLRHFMQVKSERVHQFSKRLVDPQRRLQDLQIRADELSERLTAAIFRYLEERRTSVHLALRKMGSPQEQVVRLQKRQQMAELRVKNAFHKLLERKTLRLKEQAARLDAMSPLRVVQRGYSIVQKAKVIVTSYKQVKAGEDLSIRLADGLLEVEVKKITGGPNGL